MNRISLSFNSNSVFSQFSFCCFSATTMEVHRRLLQLLPLYYLSILLSIFRKSISFFPNLKKFRLSPVAINEFLLSTYFHYCGLSPCTIDLDSETTLHFWIPNPNNQTKKPNLILIHGFGGNSKWQFYSQIGSLSRDFNLCIPDLVFFGDSYSKRSDRTEKFQARCIGEGLKKLGVDRYSVFGISYGGYVAYRMSEIYKEVIEKVVILSCGICCTKEQMEEEMKKVGRDVVEILVPKRVEDVRILMSTAMYRSVPWSPAFMLQDFINVMYMPHRKEKVELLHHLLQGDSEPLPVLHQETLIIWGDKDRFFPLHFAYQMARHLGERTRVEIIKDAGHAANMESPTLVNSLIKSFILESQS